jgi:MraZ protein
MESFVGDYTGKVDVKGRITFPSAFKKQMPDDSSTSFVIKKDIFEKCLILFTSDEWERQNKIIRAGINPYNKEHTKFLREFYRGTAEVTLDTNNRLLVPARLLEYAQIESEIYFSGQDRKIEIWAKNSYESKEESAEDFAELAEKILGGNLPGGLLNL